MKIALALGTAIFAFAAAPAVAAPAYDGAWGAAHEVLGRMLGSSESVYFGENKAREAADLVDLEEESTEETFRCRFARLIYAEQQCLN
ncbi:MAG: hypothetical protein IT535_08235 [Bauldia sp.]|nr:hypothetical protein [Bauldia sp.]